MQITQKLKGKCFTVKDAEKQIESNCHILVHDIDITSGVAILTLFSFDDDFQMGVFYIKQEKLFSSKLFEIVEEISFDSFMQKFEDFKLKINQLNSTILNN